MRDELAAPRFSSAPSVSSTGPNGARESLLLREPSAAVRRVRLVRRDARGAPTRRGSEAKREPAARHVSVRLVRLAAGCGTRRVVKLASTQFPVRAASLVPARPRPAGSHSSAHKLRGGLGTNAGQEVGAFGTMPLRARANAVDKCPCDERTNCGLVRDACRFAVTRWSRRFRRAEPEAGGMFRQDRTIPRAAARLPRSPMRITTLGLCFRLGPRDPRWGASSDGGVRQCARAKAPAANGQEPSSPSTL